MTPDFVLGLWYGGAIGAVLSPFACAALFKFTEWASLYVSRFQDWLYARRFK